MEFEDEKKLAIKLFNDCWSLIDQPSRTDAESAEMLHLAHTSRWHWGNVGGPIEKSVGEWQCSRVNSILGNGPAALLHAQQSRELISEIAKPHFMHASSTEALAYANYVLGNLEEAKALKREAIENLDGLEEDDAAHIRKQIEELPF